MSYTPQAAEVPSNRTISTTAPITGGGDLSADRVLAIPKATLTVDGYIAATDFTTFNAKVTANTAIVAAVKTKIAYDAKGLVIAGTDATTADIADSADKRYVTDADLLLLAVTSGVNTGDEDLSGYVPTSRTINGHALTVNITLSTADIADSTNKRYVTDAELAVLTNTSGVNTGDQNLSGYVQTTRTVNGYALSSNVTLSTADIADSTDKRYVTDAQRTVIGNTSGTNTGDQDLSGYVPTSRTVNGHALTSNVTVTKSDVSLGNVDNLQQAPITRTIATTAPITGGGDLSADRTIAIPKSTASVDGYLASADFTTFNNKVATARAINTTAPVTGGGDLSADRTIAIPKATTSVDGYLASADFTTFNNKQAALGFTAENVANKTTDGTLAANSDTLYPTEQAVKTYADTKQTALGYTAENLANKNVASGYAGLDASSKLAGSQQVYGTASNTACQGNDTRLRVFTHAFAFMGS